MGRSPRFSSDDVAAFGRAKILGVRSGSEHRPTGSRRWVEGFAEAWRTANTLELVPR